MANMCYYDKNRYKTYLKYIYLQGEDGQLPKALHHAVRRRHGRAGGLEELNVGRAKDILRQAQIDAEETYLEEPET